MENAPHYVENPPNDPEKGKSFTKYLEQYESPKLIPLYVYIIVVLLYMIMTLIAGPGSIGIRLVTFFSTLLVSAIGILIFWLASSEREGWAWFLVSLIVIILTVSVLLMTFYK